LSFYGKVSLKKKKKGITAGHWWLTPIIPATWDAEIGRIEVLGQSRQKGLKTPI
jgi:hypothetical protein